MDNHNIVRNILIKIVIILVFLYTALLCIRLNVYRNHDIQEGIEEEIQVYEDDTLEQIDTLYYEDANTFGTLEKLQFTVDIVSYNVDNNSYLGNTATEKGYSGILEIKFSESLNNTDYIKIEIGNTYIIEASPMMETNKQGFPLVTATNIDLATEYDISKLEEIKQLVSTFKRKSIEYRSMKLDDIINDANISYATWTQDEIMEYIELIKEKGYTDTSDVKSYVCLREDIKSTYSK